MVRFLYFLPPLELSKFSLVVFKSSKFNDGAILKDIRSCPFAAADKASGPSLKLLMPWGVAMVTLVRFPPRCHSVEIPLAKCEIGEASDAKLKHTQNQAGNLVTTFIPQK